MLDPKLLNSTVDVTSPQTSLTNISRSRTSQETRPFGVCVCVCVHVHMWSVHQSCKLTNLGAFVLMPLQLCLHRNVCMKHYLGIADSKLEYFASQMCV